jgi:hypothetical protein
LAPPWGQNLYIEDNEIHNFGSGLPDLHHHAFRFSYIHIVSEKNLFKKKNWSILTLFALPQRPHGGIGNLKFTIYAPLVPKCIIPDLNRIGTVVIKKLKMFKC